MFQKYYYKTASLNLSHLFFKFFFWWWWRLVPASSNITLYYFASCPQFIFLFMKTKQLCISIIWRSQNFSCIFGDQLEMLLICNLFPNWKYNTIIRGKRTGKRDIVHVTWPGKLWANLQQSQLISPVIDWGKNREQGIAIISRMLIAFCLGYKYTK